MTTAPLGRVVVALVVLLATALLVLTVARVPVRRDAAVAAVRAAAQLTLVALVIAWVFLHPGGVVLYLSVMLGAAAWTSTRRIGLGTRVLPVLVLAIAAGAVTAAVPVLASGALPLRAETVVPFAAQLIGGAMTAASLTGGRLRDDVRSEWDVVEGWIALGATSRQAVAAQARRSVARSLVPALDQTRSAGLVVLPGAFVGLLLGGASPAQAAQVQLLVLVGLLAAESVAAVVTAQALSRRVGALRPTSPTD
ncbi:ABC transporter permease [Cellulomonas chitinilytica]|uniref:ABC transporter permease n=1 Tax=Cellulomonas chitinilytica TaxID=398759 RepID=A0A919U0U8_9CELL|nr:ABC transporter permease [Cellulomonas chitinilytica]GIG20781.1 ABC transporter permease [Cellulomonas chitinilytica]